MYSAAVVIKIIYKYRIVLYNIIRQMLNKCCEGKPESTSKVSKIPKITFTLNTSPAHHPSYSLGETSTLKLVRENTFPHKSDPVWPLERIGRAVCMQRNTTQNAHMDVGFLRHHLSHDPNHLCMSQSGKQRNASCTWV